MTTSAQCHTRNRSKGWHLHIGATHYGWRRWSGEGSHLVTGSACQLRFHCHEAWSGVKLASSTARSEATALLCSLQLIVGSPPYLGKKHFVAGVFFKHALEQSVRVGVSHSSSAQNQPGSDPSSNVPSLGWLLLLKMRLATTPKRKARCPFWKVRRCKRRRVHPLLSGLASCQGPCHTQTFPRAKASGHPLRHPRQPRPPRRQETTSRLGHIAQKGEAHASPLLSVSPPDHPQTRLGASQPALPPLTSPALGGLEPGLNCQDRSKSGAPFCGRRRRQALLHSRKHKLITHCQTDHIRTDRDNSQTVSQ